MSCHQPLVSSNQQNVLSLLRKMRKIMLYVFVVTHTAYEQQMNECLLFISSILATRALPLVTALLLRRNQFNSRSNILAAFASFLASNDNRSCLFCNHC
jgi:hypothetical protein